MTAWRYPQPVGKLDAAALDQVDLVDQYCQVDRHPRTDDTGRFRVRKAVGCQPQLKSAILVDDGMPSVVPPLNLATMSASTDNKSTSLPFASSPPLCTQHDSYTHRYLPLLKSLFIRVIRVHPNTTLSTVNPRDPVISCPQGFGGGFLFSKARVPIQDQSQPLRQA